MEKTFYQPKQSKPANYKYSFILRLWRVEGSGMSNWQASVEIPDTGERIGFASLEQLFAFLMDFTEIYYAVKSKDHHGKSHNNS